MIYNFNYYNYDGDKCCPHDGDECVNDNGDFLYIDCPHTQCLDHPDAVRGSAGMFNPAAPGCNIFGAHGL